MPKRGTGTGKLDVPKSMAVKTRLAASASSALSMYRAGENAPVHPQSIRTVWFVGVLINAQKPCSTLKTVTFMFPHLSAGSAFWLAGNARYVWNTGVSESFLNLFIRAQQSRATR